MRTPEPIPIRAPRTELDALLARPGAYGSRLAADVDTVAAHLPLLDECVAMTANGTALISEKAPYSAPSFTGDPLEQPPGTVSLRLHRPSLQAFVAMDADDERREPPALWMFDVDHTAAHRAFLVGHRGALALDLLRLARCGEPVSAEPQPDTGSDQLGMIDAILAGGGLPDLSFGSRTGIDPQAVADLLGYLCHTGIPLTLGVPHRGCLQLHTGVLDAVEPEGGVIHLVAGACTMAYHPTQVADAWVVRSHGVHGPTSSLQLYDGAGRCAALFLQIGLVGAGLAAAWEQVVGNLAEYGR